MQSSNIIRVGNCFFPHVKRGIINAWIEGQMPKQMSERTGVSEIVFRMILKHEVPKIAPVGGGMK